MNNIHDVSHVHELAYQLARLISLGRHHDIVVYEFHRPVDIESIIECESGHEAFVSKAYKHYDGILSVETDVVDAYPASIDVVVRVNKEWLLSFDAGANYYLGYGPIGIYNLRKACYDNGILVIHSTKSVKDWIEQVVKSNNDFLLVSEVNEFEFVIKKLIEITDNIQELRYSYQDMKEENIRDHLMLPLKAYFGGVTGETKSGSGKTDIRVCSKKKNYVYIFELKFWSGKSVLTPTIDQLLSYLSWSTNYAGVVLFCKGKNFGNILKVALSHLKASYRVLPLDKSRSREIRIEVPYDGEKTVQIHMIFVSLS